MAPVPKTALPRIITYYQTHHDADGKPISILPLIREPNIAITHVIVAAIHLNAENPEDIRLNDHHPDHERFATLWDEVAMLQAAGVRVLGMLGGAAKGSFAQLDFAPLGTADTSDAFERAYAPLAALVRRRRLDGLDLDVEEEVSLRGIVRLIDRLRADFGPSFLITMAPVASALLDPRRNLSGFDYAELERQRGAQIAWYHAQFYCGWGDCSNIAMYELILARGCFPADKVVVGMVTNPENGSGFVPWDLLAHVVPTFAGFHPRFAGVSGWEYFNSLPGGRAKPWEWAEWMTALLMGQRHVSDDAHLVDEIEEEGRHEHKYWRRHSSVGREKGEEVDADAGHDGTPAAPVPQAFEYQSDGIAEGA